MDTRFFKSFDTKTDAIKFENLIKRQKSREFIERLIHSDENELPEYSMEEHPDSGRSLFIEDAR